jgi:predicted nuclease of restriction endonuclease-like RecB superfamily
MLTGDLLMFTRRQGRILPRRADPGDERLLRAAAGLAGLFQAHTGQRRGDLEEALARFAPEGVEAKRLRGLAKLLWERCEFRVESAADPWPLRQDLFDAAARVWLSPGSDGPEGWRPALVNRVGAARGLSAAQVDAALYADLEENHVISAFDPVAPERLVHRYNTAQVQGLLLRAERLVIRALWPNPQRLRQLLRYLKFFGLLFTPDAVPAGGRTWLQLTVDGPLSVLEGSTRYGVNLAQFFPALLLWEGQWRLSAELRLRRAHAPERLEVEPHPFLRSHYPDRGQWVPEDVAAFVARFNADPGPWRAAAAESIVTLPGNAFLIPDFEFRHQETGRTWLLEHVPLAAPPRMAKLLHMIEAPPARGYLLACRGAPGIPASPRLFRFHRTLTPGQVRAWLDGLASP